MDITGALTAVSTAVGIAKDLKEIDKGLGEADLKLKIAELTGALADTKIALTEIQAEIAEKDAAIEDLKKQFEIRADTVEVRGFKYIQQKDGSPVGLPFCPRCEQMDGKMIRLVRTNKPGRAKTCPQCERDYVGVSSYTQKEE